MFSEGLQQVLEVNGLPALWEGLSVSKKVIKCGEEKYFGVFFEADFNP